MPYVELAPYKQDIKGLCDDATEYFIMDNPIPSGLILWVQHTSEENRDNDFDAVRIGRGKDESEVHWWESHEDCEADIIYWMDKPIFFVPEGKRVIFRFDGATVGDHIFCTIDGYLLPKRLSQDVMKYYDLGRSRAAATERHQKCLEEILTGQTELLNSIYRDLYKLDPKNLLKLAKEL